ncbi:hypothetical protein MTO96_034101 [Rhipicephalus appendiculatus]
MNCICAYGLVLERRREQPTQVYPGVIKEDTSAVRRVRRAVIWRAIFGVPSARSNPREDLKRGTRSELVVLAVDQAPAAPLSGSDLRRWRRLRSSGRTATELAR